MKIALIGDSLTEGRPGVSFANILKERFPKGFVCESWKTRGDGKKSI